VVRVEDGRLVMVARLFDGTTGAERESLIVVEGEEEEEEGEGLK